MSYNDKYCVHCLQYGNKLIKIQKTDERYCACEECGSTAHLWAGQALTYIMNIIKKLQEYETAISEGLLE